MLQILKELLKQHIDTLDLLDWFNISKNPSIFEYDYEGMRKKMVGTDGGLYRDLMENRFHPRNIDKFEGWGFESVY